MALANRCCPGSLLPWEQQCGNWNAWAYCFGCSFGKEIPSCQGFLSKGGSYLQFDKCYLLPQIIYQRAIQAHSRLKLDVRVKTRWDEVSIIPINCNRSCNMWGEKVENHILVLILGLSQHCSSSRNITRQWSLKGKKMQLEHVGNHYCLHVTSHRSRFLHFDWWQRAPRIYTYTLSMSDLLYLSRTETTYINQR